MNARAYSALPDGPLHAMLFMFFIALQVWPAGSGPPRSSHAIPRWGVVQLVGHLTVNEDGEGSNPSAPANSFLENLIPGNRVLLYPQHFTLRWHHFVIGIRFRWSGACREKYPCRCLSYRPCFRSPVFRSERTTPPRFDRAARHRLLPDLLCSRRRGPVCARHGSPVLLRVRDRDQSVSGCSEARPRLRHGLLGPGHEFVSPALGPPF